MSSTVARARREKATHEKAASNVFPIVGIGASAGGLEAFTHVLRGIPDGANLALVLIQHLDPTYKSRLTEMLSENSNMPVAQVSNGMRVERGRVYVIPPNTSMTISQGILHLTLRSESIPRHTPIDDFLISLAEDKGSRAIGVLLSGTSIDGIQGLRSVKGAGGITMVEDEVSAKYYDLPRSAVSAGVVDLVLPPQSIAKELVRLSRHPFAPYLDDKRIEKLLPQDNLGKIFSILGEATGVDFTNYKETTIKRRILKRMVVLRIDTLEDYVNFLRSNPKETETLFQEILIHVTSFFREPKTFQTLKTDVFPKLLKDRAIDDPLRIWVPGCSTGEEAYSVAMALTEALDLSRVKPSVQIFGTDVNEDVLRKAREGVYKDISYISPGRQRRFFIKDNGNYQIAKNIRGLVIFAKQNVITDPPFSRMDLIICRNLLIYLGPLLHKKLIPILHYALKPDGFLVLGNSETIGGFTGLFESLDKKQRVYRKRFGPQRTPIDLFSIKSLSRELNPTEVTVVPKSTGSPSSPSTELEVIREADRLLLSKFAPASVIINSDMEILQFRGRTGQFLEPATGKASLNLLKMAREELFINIRAAVREAKDKNTTVRRDGIRMRTDGRFLLANLEVTPLKFSGCYLVSFEEARQGGAASEVRETIPRVKVARDAKDIEQEVAQLQLELTATKEYLQSIIEEKEGSNEDLKAANEEILSSNEELQSTNEELETAKEELQSTNEELTTVNEEIQNRNQELTVLIDDMNNLLTSANLPVVMLGSDLRIRRVTPQAEKLLNLSPHDMGRSFAEVNLKFDAPNLVPMLKNVLGDTPPKEVDVQDGQGHWFQMWIRPYKTVQNKVEGAVIAFIDTDRLKRAEERLRGHAQELEQLVQARTSQLGDALRMSAIGETAAMVGHDLRNPLQAVANLVHLAKEKAGSARDKDLSLIVDQISDQADYMNKLVTDLQDYSRSMKPRPVRVNLAEVVDGALSTLQIPKSVRVRVDVGKAAGFDGDPDLLKRALMNIISNGIQAMDDGGELSVRVDGNDAMVSISVHDSGKGLTKEIQEKMFNPLFTTKSRGTGLGLPIAKRIIEAHQGHIKVSSEPGNGTTFTIEFPLKERQASMEGKEGVRN